MKKIYDIVSMAILLFCTAACSDSYLELSPESSVSDEVIFENADAAAAQQYFTYDADEKANQGK